MLINLLKILYGISGVITFIGFIPTIQDLIKKKPSANLATYLVWTSTTLISSLYAVFIVKDLMFVTVINLQLVACLIISYLRFNILNVK
jgi:hypothetical protein